jgi:hypothetical protein
MIITNEQLKQIALAGGGLTIDASTMTLSQLREIIAAAAAGNASITVLKLSGLTAAELREMALLASHLITFDLTS